MVLVSRSMDKLKLVEKEICEYVYLSVSITISVVGKYYDDIVKS